MVRKLFIGYLLMQMFMLLFSPRRPVWNLPIFHKIALFYICLHVLNSLCMYSDQGSMFQENAFSSVFI